MDNTQDPEYKEYLEYLAYLDRTKGAAPQGPQLQEAPTGAPIMPNPAEQVVSQFKAPTPEQQRMVEGVFGGGTGEAAQIGGQVVGKIASKIPGALSKFLKPAAERSAVLSRVKDEANLAPYVGEQVQGAVKSFNREQITPRMVEQYARAGEQTIPFNPQDFVGIHPAIDAEMTAAAKAGVREMPMKEALDLRARLNDRSLFKDLGPYTPEVAAKQNAAFEAGNRLRRSIEHVDPNIAAISDELKDAYSLRNAVTGSAGKRPIETVMAPQGSTRGSNLARFDEMAGSDLRTLGQNIETARERLGSSSLPSIPTSTAMLPKVAKQTLGVAPRAYDALAELLQPAAAGAEQALQTPAAGSASYMALKKLLEEQNQGR